MNAPIEKKYADEQYAALQSSSVNHIKEVWGLFLQSPNAPAQFHPYIRIDPVLLGCAIKEAVKDLKRSVDYHSTSGPSVYKTAAFFGKWIAKLRPIQTRGNYPQNLWSELTLPMINARFAVQVLDSMLETPIYEKLSEDLEYCFEFRDYSGDMLTMLLQHSLVMYSKKSD